MAYMTLGETYSVGLHSVDEEHGKLIDLVNQIHEALQAHTPPDEIRKMLRQLADSASTHFWQEETQFAKAGYPEATMHARKHEHLMMVLSCFQNGIDRTGRPVSFEEQLGFVRDWLLDHIANEDQQFADHLGVQQRPALSQVA